MTLPLRRHHDFAQAGRRGAVRDPQLADLGARVIKVRRPYGKDFARGSDRLGLPMEAVPAVRERPEQLLGESGYLLAEIARVRRRGAI